jgi:choline-glycine betaine transporter
MAAVIVATYCSDSLVARSSLSLSSEQCRDCATIESSWPIFAMLSLACFVSLSASFSNYDNTTTCTRDPYPRYSSTTYLEVCSID